MDIPFYLDQFQKAADQLDKKSFAKRNLETAVVRYGADCVVLKVYKKSWANTSPDPLTAESRIFFSVWVSGSSIKEEKILYNIHALKLRQLKGYSIKSRDFAEIFREGFKPHRSKWKNVSTTYGPQTLMEGWQKIDPENVQHEIVELAHAFLDLADLIDDTLASFKK